MLLPYCWYHIDPSRDNSRDPSRDHAKDLLCAANAAGAKLCCCYGTQSTCSVGWCLPWWWWFSALRAHCWWIPSSLKGACSCSGDAGFVLQPRELSVRVAKSCRAALLQPPPLSPLLGGIDDDVYGKHVSFFRAAMDSVGYRISNFYYKLRICSTSCTWSNGLGNPFVKFSLWMMC